MFRLQDNALRLVYNPVNGLEVDLFNQNDPKAIVNPSCMEVTELPSASQIDAFVYHNI